jgi:hypothetical protein
MHRVYAAAIWGSLGIILVGLATVFGVWSVAAVVAAGVGGARGILYLSQRRDTPK